MLTLDSLAPHVTQSLLRSCRTICVMSKIESKQAKSTAPAYLGADDFTPIFIFVVVQALMRHPLFVADFMWNLSAPSHLSGEGGYVIPAHHCHATATSLSRHCIVTVKPLQRHYGVTVYVALH